MVEPPEAKFAGAPQGAPGRRFSRFHLAAAAALAIVAGVGGALLVENREQAKALADRTIETKSLAHAVKSLKVRVDAIDTAVSNAALADLRQSVGEIKSNTASERQISGALAQLSQRVDRLDRELSAKADKLTERVDRQAGAVAAGLSTRIDKLEQKIATPPPPPPQAAAQPKPPPVPGSAPSRWTEPARSTGQGQFCGAMWCSAPATTWRSSAGAMASVKSAREIFSPAPDGSSASRPAAISGW